MIEFKGHFDGRVIVPDEPVTQLPGQRLRIVVEAETAPPRTYLTAAELARSDVVGMWADRADIVDSTEFANEWQRRIARREI